MFEGVNLFSRSSTHRSLARTSAARGPRPPDRPDALQYYFISIIRRCEAALYTLVGSQARGETHAGE